MADQNVTPQKSLESWSFRLFDASGILGCPSLVVSDMLLGWSSMVASMVTYGYLWLYPRGPVGGGPWWTYPPDFSELTRVGSTGAALAPEATK